MCFAQFALIAMCLATWPLQFLALLGTSLPVALALIAALALGFAAGAWKSAGPHRTTIAGFSIATILHFALAAWMVASPWLVEFADWTISQPGAIRLGSPGWNTIVMFGMALVTLGCPAFVAARLALHIGPSASGRSQMPLVFLGAAAGLSLWSAGLAQILSPYYCGLAAAGLGLVIAVVQPLRQTSVSVPVLSETVLPAAPAELAIGQSILDRHADAPSAGASHWSSPGHSNLAFVDRQITPFWRTACAGLLALACGAWVAALDRLIIQLSAGSIYIGCAEVIGLCGGLALGTFLAGRSKGLGHVGRLLSVVGMSLWGVGLLAAYPLLIDLSLWLNASVSSTNLLIFARELCAGLAVLPVGMAAVGIARATGAKNAGSHGGHADIAGGLLVAALGYCAIAGAAFQHVSPDIVVIALAWLTAVSAIPTAAVLRDTLFARWPLRLVAATATGVIVIAPQWRQHFDPVRSAKLLFNSSVAYGYRSGLKPSLLVALDEGRHVATATGQRGIFTVWSYGGHQLQVRENGLPRGVVSTDPAAFPRYAPETLQTAVPCLIHGKAERVLLLGLGSGEALATALSFPIQEITCLETDAGLVRVVRHLLPSGTGAMALDDERVTLSVCDPAIGLPAVPGEFDVVVSSPENLGLAQAQPYVTTEFYRRAARKLSPGGVFCQRLQHIDLGPRPIQAITRAMQSVFSDVQAVEVAPGEMLLCATNDELGLIRPEIVARLETPQVRAVLGDSGLDWTVLLNIAAVDHQGLEKFCMTSTGPLNTACGGRLPFALPREMMRWAPKLDELHEALGPVAARLLSWVGEDGKTPVVVRRLAEVQGQYELMTKYADQFWAYRASLRDQVKDKPRSAIQLTSGTSEEKKMHPEDRRRLAYFSSLSRAIRTRSAADIERLSKLAFPYDPLITYFSHQEVAELMSRSPERDCAVELRQRLYATYYSSPRDSSLRNVLAALTLLREHPECEPDPSARWDDCNALLQALKMRWEARVGVRPADVKETINDVDQTVLAVEQTFRQLDVLTAEAGISEALWRARRSILEKTLIAPVRSYQLELLPVANRAARDAER
jgi:hypothetical protein